MRQRRISDWRTTGATELGATCWRGAPTSVPPLGDDVGASQSQGFLMVAPTSVLSLARCRRKLNLSAWESYLVYEIKSTASGGPRSRADRLVTTPIAECGSPRRISSNELGFLERPYLLGSRHGIRPTTLQANGAGADRRRDVEADCRWTASINQCSTRGAEG